MVSHCTTGPLQTKGPTTSLPYRAGIPFLLRFVDCYSRLFVSNDHVYLFANGVRKSYRDGRFMALADDVHAGALLSVYTQSEVVLRSISTDYC